MLTKNLFSEVPSTYPKCIVENCTVANHCLRHQLYCSRSGDVNKLCILNPNVVSPMDGTDCPYFHSDIPVRLARGFTQALSTVPYGNVKKVQEELTQHYCRTLYYYYRKGECVLDEENRIFVASVLQKYGASAPIEFDSYEYGYVWKDV